MEKVHILSYDHLGVILWKAEAIEKIIDQEISRLEKYPQFKVGWDHEAFGYEYLDRHHPEILSKMKEALIQFRGRLGIGTCTYGQPLSTFISEESNIRQITYAIHTIGKIFGSKPGVYIMSEHAFHAQLPRILAACGFKGAILRTHFMMYGCNPEADAPVVWWTGADGSRIPAVPTYVGQARDIGLGGGAFIKNSPPFGAVTLDNKILTDSPLRYSHGMEEFTEAFGGKIRPLVASRADDPRQIEGLIAEMQKNGKYVWTLAEDVFKHLPEPEAELRTMPEDFKTRMPWGFCGNWIWNRSREAEVKVQTAERLSAIGCLLGGPDFENSLENAWKDLLTGQHHDIQIVGLEEDAHVYLDAAVEKAEEIIKQSNIRLLPGSEKKGDHELLVFNPLPWDRREWLNFGEGGFIDIPALGFAAVKEAGNGGRKSFAAADAEGRIVITDTYRLVLGEEGGILSLLEKTTGKELFKPGILSGTLAGMIDGQNCESRGRSEIVNRGEWVRIIEKGMVGTLKYSMEWTFYDGLDGIYWRCNLEANGEKIGLPGEDRADAVSAFLHEYKLRLRFYPEISGRVTGIRDLPFVISETEDKYVEGNYWTALSNGEDGLALFNRGLMCGIREEDGALSVPLAFSMYYVWDGCLKGIEVGDGEVSGMMGDEAAGGPHFMTGQYSYELLLMPFKGSWKKAEVHKKALEYNYPCVVLQGRRPDTCDGKIWQPLRLISPGAILSALYTKNRKIYARFYEYRGETGEVSVEWETKPVKLTETDMLENSVGDPVDKLFLGPWEIKTVEINIDTFT